MLVQQPLLQAQRLLSWLAGDPSSASNNSLADASIQPSPMSIAATLPLFGSNRPWNEPGKVKWVSVDDRVRGGSSQSHLEEHEKHGSLAARFFGTLDTKTLGGAGFASVITEYGDSDWETDLSSYDGILLRLSKGDDKKYTFILKDEVPGRRDDGRMKSGISWEFDFYCKNSSSSLVSSGGSSKDPIEIYAPWNKFNATYRGKEVKDPAPLKTVHIKRYSIMARSFFEKQDGDFDITFDSILAYKHEDSDAAGRAQL